MNVKRYFGAALALFVFIFFYEWLVHGVLLMHSYEQTAPLWRTFQEMKSYMPFAWLVHLFTAAWFTFAFAKFYKNGGVKQGLHFGLFVGVIMGIYAASSYIWMPISAMLAWGWLLSSIVKFLVGGVIVGKLYRKQ